MAQLVPEYVIVVVVIVVVVVSSRIFLAYQPQPQIHSKTPSTTLQRTCMIYCTHPTHIPPTLTPPTHPPTHPHRRERARAVTTVFGGLDVGSAVGLLLCGPLIRLYGWPIVFYAFAGLGLVWCLFWPLVKPEQADPKVAAEMASAVGEGACLWVGGGWDGGCDTIIMYMHLHHLPPFITCPPSNTQLSIPKTHTHTHTPPKKHTEAAKPDKQSVPWGEFLKAPAVWAVIVAHFCYNWGYYTLLAWLPSYFELALGLNVDQSSLLTLIPYIAMTAMTPFVGPVADGLVSRYVMMGERGGGACGGVVLYMYKTPCVQHTAYNTMCTAYCSIRLYSQCVHPAYTVHTHTIPHTIPPHNPQPHTHYSQGLECDRCTQIQSGYSLCRTSIVHGGMCTTHTCHCCSRNSRGTTHRPPSRHLVTCLWLVCMGTSRAVLQPSRHFTQICSGAVGHQQHSRRPARSVGGDRCGVYVRCDGVVGTGVVFAHRGVSGGRVGGVLDLCE